MAHQRGKPDSLLASPTYRKSTSYGTASSALSEESSTLFTYSVDSVNSAMECENLIPSSSSSERREALRKRVMLRASVIFGFAVVVGIVLWIGVGTLEWDEGGFVSLLSGDDDDRYSSWTDHVPLLGHSKYKAQQEADRALDFLNMEDNVERKAQEPLWGSSYLHQPDTRGSIRNEALPGCEATIMIMRHCEKGSVREHCNYLGYERSVYLASLFGDGPEYRWPKPSYIFAEAPGFRRNPNKRNFRELETVLPLADKFNITVDTSFTTLHTDRLARHVRDLLWSGDMCGKLLVISWKHSKLPKLAHALGCGPSQGCPHHYRGREFDRLWQMKFVYDKHLHSTSKRLKKPKYEEWLVYGTVQQEDFDPLAFSKRNGDYPHGGTSKGGRWRDFDHEIPERESVHEVSDRYEYQYVP